MQDLTIIILTYNSSQIIKQCLDSFNNNNYQVIVVDNASSDETLQIIKANFPLVKIIRNDKNIGFGRANNLAINQVKTNFSLILNPDTIIKDAAIAMKEIEMIADEFASRKVREFVKLGFISQPNNSALSQYKNVPLHHFEALISQTKQTIKDKGVSSFDDIADIFYNMIKVNS